MIRITYTTNHYECTVEMPLIERDVIDAVLDAVAEFIEKLTRKPE